MYVKDSPERREKILQFLRAGHSLTIAAGKAGISRDALMRWRKADKDFTDACDAAACEGLGSIEDAMVDRAKDRDDPNGYNAAKFILERRAQTKAEYAPVSHNHPFLAIQNNYLNPLAQLAPSLMQLEKPFIEGETDNG
jgi:hypothetical protein